MTFSALSGQVVELCKKLYNFLCLILRVFHEETPIKHAENSSELPSQHALCYTIKGLSPNRK